MLTVHDITKSYGMETILNKVSFTLDPGERLGLVGANGSGKTTLIRIITGEERPDSGSVRFNPQDLRPGYLPQGFRFEDQDTLGSYLARMGGDSSALERRLEELSAVLAQHPDQPKLQKEYDAVLERLARAAEFHDQLQGALGVLGLDAYPLDTPSAILSGGQKMRLGLAGLLLSRPRLLLLDEPTNHLDIRMLEWLEDWLGAYRGAALIVSHDRAFLDRSVTAILELDALTHTLKRYEGNYSDYLEQKSRARGQQLQAYQDQQVEIARLRRAAMHVRMLTRPREGGKASGGDKFAKGFFANRGLNIIRRAKHLEERIDQLNGENRLEKPARMWEMKAEFLDVPESGRDVLVMEGLSVGYDHPLLQDIRLTLRHGQRTVLTGDNGCGKTTLLRTVAGLIPPLAGRFRLGSGVRLGMMAQEQENLDPALNPFEIIYRLMPRSETAARSFLSKFLFKGDDVFIPVPGLSYGERARLSLAVLAAQGCNLLLLDEPVNHLDIPARTRFEQALSSYEGTVLAVVHDRYFIEGFATEIWEASGGEVRIIG